MKKLELNYSTDGGVKGHMTIYPERLFPMTRAKLKRLDKVVQMDFMNRDTFWTDAVETLKTDGEKWLDGQIEAYDRIAERNRYLDKDYYRESKKVANAYRRAKKKLKDNIEFIERNFINDHSKTH